MTPVDRGEGCFSIEEGHGLFRGFPDGVSAGFTTRRNGSDGGASRLARALAAGLGVPSARLALARQVHGRQVLVVDAAAARRGDFVGIGDALMTREDGVLLGIQSADCVPVLLSDTKGPWIAAVHAGWRGTAARVLDAVLDLLERNGVDPARLVVAIGPCISQGRYEVGPEVVEALSTGHAHLDVPAGAIRPGRHDRTHVDVAAFNKAVLVGRGVPPGSILDAALCTAEHPELFPSYRRDGKGTGRIVTGIVRPGAG